METVLKAIADWIKGILTAGIMSNLSGLFDAVNEQVGDIAQQVGTRPSAFEPRVFAMIESLSRNVVLPIAGIILTFIACYELIEMITQHNNMAQFEPALIMRWIFKTAVSVWFIQGHQRQLTAEEKTSLKASIDNRYQERAVANGSLMMCEVQGAKEDFIRRWNTIFKEYPDVFEDSDCRKIIHDLTEDAVQYLLKIKEKTL